MALQMQLQSEEIGNESNDDLNKVAPRAMCLGDAVWERNGMATSFT
jgi:hypothetical protein